MVAIKAVIPPVTCTTPLPAKSIVPIPPIGSREKAERNPLEDQTAWTITGYTKPVKNTEYEK
jgi:hypothetical protein